MSTVKHVKIKLQQMYKARIYIFFPGTIRYFISYGTDSIYITTSQSGHVCFNMYMYSRVQFM